MRADADAAAEPPLEVPRGREVVGVGVGLEDPVDHNRPLTKSGLADSLRL
jgi:hypothetical protein